MRNERSGPPFNQPVAINYESRQAERLAALWCPLASRGTTVMRELVRQKNGTVTAASAWASDPVQGSVPIYVDSTTNTHLNIGGIGAYLGTTIYTIAAWFMTTGNPATRQTVIADFQNTGSAQSFNIEISGFGQPSEHIVVQHGATYRDSGIHAVANQWYHVVASWDATTTLRRLYVNGQLKDSVSGTISMANGVDAYLGRLGAYAGGYFVGRIGEVRMYKRVLSDGEVWQLWNPDTCWDLYAPLQRLWILPFAAVPPTGRKYGPAVQIM